MDKTAILVDGAFYLKMSKKLFGEKNPEERADELYEYCLRHLKYPHKDSCRELYRIFFYNCPPSDKTVYNPLTKKSVNLSKQPIYKWTNDFHNALIKKRKVALRFGELLEGSTRYALTPDSTKRLLNGSLLVDELTQADLYLDISQKGVDMRIGLDIASLAYKRLVDQIVLIAGDSDFVPAAKHARREGIDFILDPMWHTIKPSLNEHIDGLRSCTNKPGENHTDPLYKLTKSLT